ncbi:dnaA protein helix-turn-helix [Faunimonas pinastri]|uniref:DnaA protein helix-turn-helix n=1 Tax=Faunimonas pinastri TaxID=1855383 RepID=A0A1H9MBM5_9HYPH|nr:helix-turn-helix domain-containing protein [Faunimonas pinastri]SER20533.1 dnaA protein helix-turn-helix [Faunimonas pinastri]
MERVISGEVRRPERLKADAMSACRAIEGLVGTALGVSLSDLRGGTRGRAEIAFARQCAMYLAHVGLGLSPTEVGKLFRRDRTTVSHGCAVVEDRRDDPKVDRILNCLEAALVTWQDTFLGSAG